MRGWIAMAEEAIDVLKEIRDELRVIRLEAERERIDPAGDRYREITKRHLPSLKQRML